jgi:AcrR family transcriptional regulator
MGTTGVEVRRVDARVLEERRARRRARVIAHLLDVVEGLLVTHGSLLEVNVEEILTVGGMSRSTFYRYFHDKIDLVIALGGHALVDVIAAAQAIWELPPESERADVARAVEGAFAAYLPHTRLMAAALEVSTYDERAREHFGAAYARAQDAIAQHIRAGQEAGSVRADLHPEETAGWLTWMVERGMTKLVRDAEPAQLTRLQESLTAVIWHTLYDG